MKVKEDSGKIGLKLNIQKMNTMASGPITSWEIDGETVTDFVFLGSKITAYGDCSHEIKRHLRNDAKAETPVLGHLMQRVDSLEKTPMLGKIEGRREGDDRDEMDGWHH